MRNSRCKKMKLPLKFFVDSLISESSLPFAAQWNQDRLAYKDNELAGDERFFELLEDDKKDPTKDSKTDPAKKDDKKDPPAKDDKK